MTAAEAYLVKPMVVDRQGGTLPKLVTTGLIDPAVCFWGLRTCRYLKQRYNHPRINPETTSGSLARRLADSARPKVIVAGLSRRVECFLDSRGEYAGAVSTWSIFHPADKLKALEQLEAFLNSDQVSHQFRAVLGANAMGGGNITMRKSFLRELQLPNKAALAAAGTG
jgi:hypothetical protein